jgi:hypothetical protein
MRCTEPGRACLHCYENCYETQPHLDSYEGAARCANASDQCRRTAAVGEEPNSTPGDRDRRGTREHLGEHAEQRHEVGGPAAARPVHPRPKAPDRQRQLAERAGMSQPGVARFEAGGTTPTLPLLERLAEVGNRSANSSGGNTSWRCRAKNANTLSSGTRCPTSAAASSSSVPARPQPCIRRSSHASRTPGRQTRSLFSRFLAAGQ